MTIALTQSINPSSFAPSYALPVEVTAGIQGILLDESAMVPGTEKRARENAAVPLQPNTLMQTGRYRDFLDTDLRVKTLSGPRTLGDIHAQAARLEMGVGFAHNAAPSILIVGGRIYLLQSNGSFSTVTEKQHQIPVPYFLGAQISQHALVARRSEEKCVFDGSVSQKNFPSFLQHLQQLFFFDPRNIYAFRTHAIMSSASLGVAQPISSTGQLLRDHERIHTEQDPTQIIIVGFYIPPGNNLTDLPTGFQFVHGIKMLTLNDQHNGGRVIAGTITSIPYFAYAPLGRVQNIRPN